MAKIIDTIVQSDIAPKNTNVLWDDGENLKIQRNGVWSSVTKSSGGNIPSLTVDKIDWNEVPEDFSPENLPVTLGTIKEEYREEILKANTIAFEMANNPFDLPLHGSAMALTEDGIMSVYLNYDVTPGVNQWIGLTISAVGDIVLESVYMAYSVFITDFKDPSTIEETNTRLNTVNMALEEVSFTDEEKAQALSNLGIADLLEALKPVQLSGYPPTGEATQEQLDEIGLTEKVINNIVSGYTNKIHIGGQIFHVINANTTPAFTFINFFFDSNGSVETYTQYKCEKEKNHFNIEVFEM